MLARATEIYRGYGIVIGADRRGRLEAMIFPGVLASGEVIGSALFEVAQASAEEGREALRARAHAIVDARLTTKS
jgi:hypothetical protein